MQRMFDILAQRQPVAARWIHTAATLAVMTLPAATILAILSSHTIVAQAGALASVLFYAVGCHSAAARYGQRLRQQLAAARRDALTGLPTRAVADKRLEAATRDATPVSVALADVDGLKPVNTNLGHAAGDQYLQVVARRLAAAVPPGGLLARLGGDEFCLIAHHTDPADLAVRIGAAMAGPAVIGGLRIQPRASIGVAASAGGDAFHARACADAAMYSAKAAGGNHTLVYDPDRDERPQPDGTRPLVRRRDLDPLGRDGMAWLPAPGDQLLPVLWSVAEARTAHQALVTARDLWTQAAAEATAGATQPPPHASADMPDRINIEPTPPGYQAISLIAQQEQARYARLVDRLARLIDAAQPADHDDDAAAR
jgi:diguanylate cyclase (GGDEF)-like protein